MCGICGYSLIESFYSNEKIKTMLNKIRHRGPDSDGFYIENNTALGHSRLSILDLSITGNQPMYSDDEKFVIVFNGEIYNFQELKKELIALNISFKSTTDTEVVLKGFQAFGVEYLKKLNGIFALAIWDKDYRKLTLARDRYGVKPLYYAIKGKGVVFGSEIKALMASGLIVHEFNHQGFSEFLFYGNCLAGRTLNGQINNLSPGSYLEVSTQGVKTGTFWRIDDVTLNHTISKEEAVVSAQQLLEASVKRQLIADVPVGIFLSGGIDSSSITAFASKHYSGKIKTYSVGFDFDMGVNELPKAKRIAAHYDTEHHELFITADNLPFLVEKLVECHDQPFSDAANIPLYLLCGQVKDKIKVVLQGDGGDEFFGGYRRHHLLSYYDKYKKVAGLIWGATSVMPGSLGERVKRFANFFRQEDFGKTMALMLTVETDYDSPLDILDKEFKAKMSETNPFSIYEELNKRFSHHDLVQQMLWSDTQVVLPDTFLEKVDKSTMAQGVEARVPFLDNELTDFVLSLPASMKVLKGEQKGLLKQAMRGIVPDFVLDGKKTGFGVPYGNWLKGPLYDYFNDTISSQHFLDSGIFDSNVIKQKMSDYKKGKKGKKDNGFLLWKVLNFAIWSNKY